MKRNVFDNEDGSASVILLFFITIFLGIFVWIGSGYVVDILTSTQNAMVSTTFPMSQDRLNTTNWLVIGFKALPTLGIVMPMIVYTISVARRREDSVVM